MSVCQPLLSVNTHLWERVPVVCRQSGSPACLAVHPIAHCARMAAEGAQQPMPCTSVVRKPREEPEECGIWNLRPEHGLVLLSLEKQMLLGVA